jgi:YfiH family protein
MLPTMRCVRVPALDAIGGLVHGFEQRIGPAGWESRDEARRRAAKTLAPMGRLFLMKQVHGADVRRAPWDGLPEADAALAEGPGCLVGVETADCLPVLLVDPRRRAVAAAHAGWRGTAIGVVRAAVGALLSGGSMAEDLVAALGPSIGRCCYEVGGDVVAAFEPWGRAFFEPGPRGRPHLDLRAANARVLVEHGLAPERIHHVPDCTFCQGDRYHSFRREGRGGGRMVNFVGWSLGDDDADAARRRA